MKKGIVAIVGRPNVGKSSLFNRIIKQKKSIVENTPGVTRDRIYGTTEWLTREFIVIDTGGITLEDQPFAKEIKIQAEIAIEEADVIVFVLNHKEQLTEEDKMIARILYKTKKPVILAVNKYDKKTNDYVQYEYMSLGLNEPIMMSATHGIGIGDLLDSVIKLLPSANDLNPDMNSRIAIIGRPNVGKSSLVNSLLNETRMIVSEIPGTTIDAVDSVVKVNNIEYTIVDTAGIRKKSKIFRNIEKYSYLRSLTTINGSDIIILMLDSSETITDLDTNIGGLAFEEKKPIIIVANKWDLVEDKEKKILEKEEEIRSYFKYLAYAKVLFVSTRDKTRISKIFSSIEDIKVGLTKKIKTSVFNEVLNKAQLINPAPNFNGGRLKIYYGSQVEAYLPTFVLFVNNPDYVHFSYKRFIENQIRLQFGFEGVPINIIFRERK
ncbi:GTP-binding protein EngA [Entomoplasma ellychniae]|uniref:GTPase Der n=1 Tax=Entomoplasma ellychniae TaxID=2114 RepID=A0A8E2QY41_9MOLU|nr:ribosome biogenesis GTPase Der [Entomoplasma ellychniae]PPE04993.1 GTP-binding protein EngA [Entomoplasma ellychniae]